ncbi:hypothetical protein WN48_02141 [Eufriesea mexicana]|uniref:Uncharacterized protein n=1 Tax=Eufriesea mexicana TaxID=516756 RepID=A0A310SQS3_9HYME|nr:hypothetical protein WN48_02141 [Eufriesea mexicana]
MHIGQRNYAINLYGPRMHIFMINYMYNSYNSFCYLSNNTERNGSCFCVIELRYQSAGPITYYNNNDVDGNGKRWGDDGNEMRLR